MIPRAGKSSHRRAAADLDLLAIGQPVALLEQRALQHDADVFELGIQIRGRREAEAEPDELRGGDVEVERADHQRAAERARPDLHLAHHGLARRGPDGQRVAESVVVRPEARRRQRMRHVADFVALADPDDVAEVVGDDAEVIAVVVDVRRQEGAVAPAEDDLLAPVRGAPIHFHAQLVGLDQPGRLGQSLAHLRQEEHEAVRPAAVALERRVGLRRSAALGGAVHERQRVGRVPLLRGERETRRSTTAPAPHATARRTATPLTLAGSR